MPRKVDVSAPPDARLDGLRRLARILDDAFEIPGTGFRIGLDPLVGLVPGLGDLLPALAGAYGLVVAWRLGAPASLLLRMAANLGLDALAGAVPLLGDLFDAAWKPHVRNLALLEGWLGAPGPARRASRWLAAGLVAAVLAAAAGVLLVAWAVVAWAARLVAGG